MAEKKPEMFMRFYGDNAEANAEQCMKELQPLMDQHGYVSRTTKELTRSMNLLHPGGVEVLLQFETLEGLTAFKNSDDGPDVYMKYAYPEDSAIEFHQRKPTDMAYGR